MGHLDGLAPRERQVFGLAARGLSNVQIARKLRISDKTVETYRARINRKLDIHSSVELVLFAVKYGLLTARDL